MDIDYIDAGQRQETISVFALYFYIVQNNNFIIDIGNLIIALLLYMVEEGRLEGVALHIKHIRSFIYEYIDGLDNLYDSEKHSFDEITEYVITRLQGARATGQAILFSLYDGEAKKSRSTKIAYINYDVKMDGYKITEKGLEFLISSKEIPQEARLTVSLYLFKLQLDRKKYKSALSTIRNINTETIRQLEEKETILSLNRSGHKEATKKYSQYWENYYDIRQEETNNYNDAKDRLALYRDSAYLRDNEITLTPDELDTLAAIETELSKSGHLQSRYTTEIAKMSGEMLDIDKRSLINEFMTSFNLKQHFQTITAPESPVDALRYSLQPLFLPKRKKYFGLDLSFAPQAVIKKKNVQTDEPVDEHASSYTNRDDVYNNRIRSNYFTIFKLLIRFLTEIRNPITQIEQFIEFSVDECGDKAVSSIDFLSFLLSLCLIPDNAKYNAVNTVNVQTLILSKTHRITDVSLDKMHIQELFTYFWFHEMGEEYDCTLEISTEPDQVVYLDEKLKRSIGNIQIRMTRS